MSKSKGFFVVFFIAMIAVLFVFSTADAASNCKDRDGDGYYGQSNCGTLKDCDDRDAAINPGAEEDCNDGIDNDCDQLIDQDDPDAVNCPTCIPTGYPDTNCDGVDDDCDGTPDDNYMTTPTTCGVGECSSTGQLECQSGSEVNTCTPLPAGTEGPVGDETCSDGSDNDCDGDTDSNDSDCICIPTGPDNNCDGIDNDCNGTADDGYMPSPTTCGTGACEASGQLECQNGAEVNTCTPGAPQNEGPEGDPTCGDMSDNDCDGATDGGDPDCQADCSIYDKRGPCNDDPGCMWEGPKKTGQCVPIPITCMDNDGDGYGVNGDPSCQFSGIDCNDNNSAINPGADDSNCNGVDEDCSGINDDGYIPAPTTCGVGECSGNTGQLECQSGSEVDTCDPLAGALPDNNCDGLDNDCDGTPDDNYVTTPTTCGVGECTGNAGQLTCQSGSEVDTCDPLAGALPDNNCDGLDNDCDGTPDDDYVTTPTTCGVGECSGNTGQLTCQSGSEVDTCDPLAGAGVEGPENDPTCGDTLDNDCDGLTDTPEDPDCACVQTGLPDDNCDGIDDDCNGVADDAYVPPTTTCGEGECAGNTGLLECQGGSTVDTCDPLAGALPDNNCDGLDNDCDGPVDEDFATTPTTCGVGECAGNTGQVVCQSGSEVDTCDPLAGASPDDTLCNDLDDDCDGAVDEDYLAMPTTCGVGECSGNTGLLECQSGTEVDTCDPLAGAALDDSFCNGLDDDCDGPVDEDFATTPTTCGVGECSGNTGLLECQSGSEVDTCDPFAGAVQEGPFDDLTCGDTIDNDCDGSADLLDNDCLDPDADNDGDTYSINQGDCDDLDPDVNPGATEVCDGKDTNCDNIQLPTDVDNDNDGHPVCLNDCNDNDPDTYPGAPELCDGIDNDCSFTLPIDEIDADGDGFRLCDTTPDCDDNDFSVFPGALEECDFKDNNCNGLVDDDGTGQCACVDTDGDGQLSDHPQCGGTDCENSDPDVYLGAQEICTDGKDNDCDDIVDIQDPDAVGCDPDCVDNDVDTFYVDSSGTGKDCGIEDCNDDNPDVNPDATEVCDGEDTNCDGFQLPTDIDVDNDGVPLCLNDCDDNDPNNFPGNDENCVDGQDNNCNFLIDLVDPVCQQCTPTGLPDDNCDGVDDDCDFIADDDYVPPPTTCGVGECAGNTGLLECQGGNLVNTCDPLEGALPTDNGPNVCNGLDDDCDGFTDEDFVSTPTTCGVGVCASTGDTTCIAGVEGDNCEIQPQEEPADFTCDGRDGDCDGQTDEDFITTPTNCGQGVCASTGDIVCQSGSEVNTCTPGPQDEPTDITCNNIDGDCDGQIDEDYVITGTTCGVGECAGNTGQLTCQGGGEIDDCDPFAGAVVEGPTGDPTCEDGLDNNCNGLTDTAEDPNCQCTPTGSADDNCDGIDDDCNGVADDAYPSTPTTCGQGVCASAGEITCVDAEVVDTCVPGPQDEPTDITCDGIDGDCDGQTDEDYAITPTTCGQGECAGNAGQLECQGGGEVDTCDPFAGAAPDDSLCNGLDDDCDGPADEDYVTSTSDCGVGECSSTGLLQCLGGTETDNCTPGSPPEPTEVTCDDNLDNDCDGLTDTAEDPDCDVSSECIVCHNGVPSGGSGYVLRDVVGGDFIQSSRHIFGGSPTNWDCIVCHREGDEDAAQAPGGVVANTAFHQDAQVDMRNVDNPTAGWVWDKNNTDELMYMDMDTFCMHCHDSDSSRGAGLGGASGIAVATGDDGVSLSPTMDERMKPWNSSDGLDQGTGGGTKFLAGYERTAVLDAYGQYDPANPAHHAVRGRAYSTHDADWGDNAWVDIALKGSGLGLVSSGLYETATLHCADCHTVDQAAHGGVNGFMLQASSIDGTCYRCHSDQVYKESGALSGSRWAHDSQDAGNFFDTGNAALIGQYRGNPGSVCLNCHGGKIGEGGTFIGYDGYGGIHGLPSGADSRSLEERYRFQGGSYMSHSPGSWTTTAGSNTCYFDSSSGDQDWSNCGRHSGDDSGRTPTMNYDRPVPDNPDAP